MNIMCVWDIPKPFQSIAPKWSCSKWFLYICIIISVSSPSDDIEPCIFNLQSSHLFSPPQKAFHPWYTTPISNPMSSKQNHSSNYAHLTCNQCLSNDILILLVTDHNNFELFLAFTPFILFSHTVPPIFSFFIGTLFPQPSVFHLSSYFFFLGQELMASCLDYENNILTSLWDRDIQYSLPCVLLD